MVPEGIICSQCNQCIEGALEVLKHQQECNVYQLITGIILDLDEQMEEK